MAKKKSMAYAPAHEQMVEVLRDRVVAPHKRVVPVRQIVERWLETVVVPLFVGSAQPSTTQDHAAKKKQQRTSRLASWRYRLFSSRLKKPISSGLDTVGHAPCRSSLRLKFSSLMTDAVQGRVSHVPFSAGSRLPLTRKGGALGCCCWCDGRGGCGGEAKKPVCCGGATPPSSTTSSSSSSPAERFISPSF